MSQLTVKDIDDELNARICQLAEREGISPSQAALRLLRKGAGVAAEGENARKPARPQDESGKKATRDPALARVIGSMTAAEADELNAAVEEMFENIDEEMWR